MLFLSFVVGFVIVSVFALALGLVFGTANVFFRDSENFVDLINMVVTWLSPVLYMWVLVANTLPHWAVTLYKFNPLTTAVELFHDAFWASTVNGEIPYEVWHVMPHLFSSWTLIALVLSFGTLLVGDLLFRHFEGKFAQEL